MPWCSRWILVVCTEVPLAFASCIVLVFVVRNYLRIRVLPAARATLSERAFICRLGFTAVLTIILMYVHGHTASLHWLPLNQCGFRADLKFIQPTCYLYGSQL
jgi:hypothetical protein